MKTFTFSILLFLSTHFCHAQSEYLVDFEEIGIAADSFLNGSDGALFFGFPEDMFNEPNFKFPVDYNPNFGGFWAGGWAISTILDTMTGDFTNLYGAAAGRGNESLTYAVGQQNSYIDVATDDQLVNGAPLTGFYVTNTTYAARVIRDGNDFTDGPFGGDDGNRPDYFRLKVKAFSFGQATGDSTEIYLADYRFDDNNQDYIIENWTFVEVSNFSSIADSIVFSVESSDVGGNGINTPTFFAIDDISFNILSSTRELSPELQPTAYPNPIVSGPLQLQWSAEANWQVGMRWYLHDALGRPITGGNQQPHSINLDQEPAGVYYLIISQGTQRSAIRILKN